MLGRPGARGVALPHAVLRSRRVLGRWVVLVREQLRGRVLRGVRGRPHPLPGVPGGAVSHSATWQSAVLATM